MSKVTLYQFMPLPDATPQVSFSPFCVKLEAYLILTGRAYETRGGIPPFTPTGTLPYMSYNNKIIGDSQAIIEKMESENKDKNSGLLYKTLGESSLSPEQQALSLEIRELVETKLYFSALYSRYATDEGWKYAIEGIKFGMPRILWCCLPNLIRALQIEKCKTHGCTSDDTAFQNVGVWLNRVTEVLGDKPFLFGAEPHVADCSLFGFLILAKGDRHKNPITKAVKENYQLMDFVARMARLLKI